MTRVDIISGFLGAGKTTLIKKLLKEALSGRKVVLIENEFGEIGIDGGFLKEAGIQITEMNSGCICCSLVGDFGEALKKVLAEYAPDRIIIEPSGVGKLSDIIRAVAGVEGMLVNSATAVVSRSGIAAPSLARNPPVESCRERMYCSFFSRSVLSCSLSKRLAAVPLSVRVTVCLTNSCMKASR